MSTNDKIKPHEARKDGLRRRSELSPERMRAESEAITDRVTGLNRYREADKVLVYASYGSEVDTAALISRSLCLGKKVYCPKVTDPKSGHMEFYRILSLVELSKGYHGIPEPNITEDGSRSDENDNAGRSAGHRIYLKGRNRDHSATIVLVPGTAFDRELNRCGYGGGFYDRYLEEVPGACLCGICYDEQIHDKAIDTAAHDRKMDMIISAGAVIS